MVIAVENRFGLVETFLKPIEWLTDDGSWFIPKESKSLLDIGVEPCSTAEALVKTFKPDYVSVNSLPDPSPSWPTVLIVRTLQHPSPA